MLNGDDEIVQRTPFWIRCHLARAEVHVTKHFPACSQIWVHFAASSTEFRVPTLTRGRSSSSKASIFQRRYARRRAAAQDTPTRKHRSSFHGHANPPEYNLRTRRRRSRQEYQGSSITSTEPYANQGDERFNHAWTVAMRLIFFVRILSKGFLS